MGSQPLRTFWMSVMSVSLMTLFLLEEPDLELELSKHRWLQRKETGDRRQERARLGSAFTQAEFRDESLHGIQHPHPYKAKPHLRPPVATTKENHKRLQINDKIPVVTNVL